ncbi:MAG: ParB/RepB/Spo0J family partition protein [Bacteroidetes bacterium]|nr:ParB/RepB/Spo0J family partition protein [Bacteroidota bacterium]
MENIIENKLQILEINSIELSKTNPRKDIDEKSLKELSDSINQKGILQPILVRPKGKNFELVCGERRFRASLLAKQTTIPANIRELTDEEAFEIQIIENLERKDVHPLDEADAFKKMVDSGNYTIADIAVKLSKSEVFVTGRLKLVDLIEPIRNHFKAGYLGISHATLIAKCEADKQEQIYSSAKPWRETDEPDYGTLQSIKEFIKEESQNLSDAPFDLADDLLVNGVCACVVCPKRSKANPMLFAEFQEEDNCFDETCYNNKLKTHTHKEVARIINENEDVFIISSHSKPDEVIINICKEFNIKILKQYDDYRGYSSKGFTAAKGFCVSGHDIGKYENIWVKNESKEIPGITPEIVKNETIKEDISKIEERAKRALELDAEKVWAAIRTIDKSTFKNNDAPLSNNEKVALIVALHSECYQLHNELDFVKHLNINKILTEAIPDQLVNLTIRHFISHKLNVNYGSHENNSSAAAYKQILEEYYSEDIKSIEAAQQEIADKRIERSTQRIDALKSQLEVIDEKTTKTKKTPKSK